MNPGDKQAILIGNTNLCIQCAEHLLSNDWEILAIITDDAVVIEWTNKKNILYTSLTQVESIQTENYYLFSIVTPHIIPLPLIKNAKLAVNCHASLLPKYAGINGISWAIINGEEQHGVTLHQIILSTDLSGTDLSGTDLSKYDLSGVDELSANNGDIILQSNIIIEDDETAMSLNLKCNDHLLLIFQQLVRNIDNDNIYPIKQDFTQRSYYGLNHILDNFGIVNDKIYSFDVLNRLNRGLTFGNECINPIGSIKIFLDNKFYIVEDFNTNLLLGNTNTTNNNIALNRELPFNTIKDIYGNKLNLEIVPQNLPKYKLNNSSLDYLSNIKRLENSYKQQILDFLNKSDSAVEVINYALNNSSNEEYFEHIALPQELRQEQVLSLIHIVLMRFFNENFLISVYFSDESIPTELYGLVEKRNFIFARKEFLNEDFLYLTNYWLQLQQNSYILSKDFAYRHKLQLVTDIAITLGNTECNNKHKIIINISDNQIKIKGNLCYKPQIDGIAECIKTLLLKDVKNEIISHNLRTINLISDRQYQTIASHWNKLQKIDYKMIHQVFEEQTLITPDNIAVVYENIQLSYAELNERANCLANLLIEGYQIKPGNMVALGLEPSEYMIIAMLATLKAGATYLPINFSYPDERIKYVLKDADTRIIITHEKYQIRLNTIIEFNQNKPQTEINIILIDSPNVISELADQKSINPDVTIDTKQTPLACLFYTSGTTGVPKGVMVEHCGIVSLVKDVDFVKINATDCILQVADPMFDVATFEIWGALLQGAKLYIPANKLELFADVDLFASIIINYNVSILLLTKTVFDQLYLQNNALFCKLKYLLITGEALNYGLVNQLVNSRYKPQHVINAYGPTENTTFSCALDIQTMDIANLTSIPIGKPINNRSAYVLDANLQLMPINAVGELYVGGIGVARGYLNLPELTKEKFIPNPFQSKTQKQNNINHILYKTGDRARILNNGNIEYLGRNDNQIKLHGYRIELSEIANKLLEYPTITQAVAIVKQYQQGLNMHNYLIAYYVAVDELSELDLLNYLATKLPQYMLPNTLIHLHSLPYTINGKLNKCLLPDIKNIPNHKNANNHAHISSRSNLENKIVTIWSDVLKLPKNQIGIEDNFFKLGGNSLLITVLRRNLATLEEFKNIKVVDLFKYPTIQQLSNFVTQTSSSASTIKLTNNSVHSKETDIAIISISGAFSGGESIDEYWELIKSGNTGLSRQTIEECRNLGITEDVLKHPNFIPVTGKISNTNSFDAEFWKMKPAEIHKLDPQIRKFLEHCWYVLEKSGYLLDRTRLNIGVFAGGRDSPHLDNNPAQFTGHSILGTWGAAGDLSTHSMLAMQVSYMLGLTGVAHNIDTACSTSLVAIIEACKNMANGYCDMALAGGVSLILPNEVGYIYKENHVFAKDGQLRAFDSESSGMVSGSGVGVVLLKPLSAAQRDNDNIIAVIKGYAVNNDGNRKMSYTAPSVVGQAECIVNAQKMAGIFPDEISYVECHGSGTKLGDTIEIQALSEAFKYNSRSVKVDHKCDIGSVKANIGHTELASGVAGLIKVCNMLEHNIIPGQINFNKPNTNLNLDETPFVIPTATHHWLNSNQQHRFAGVSSFGIGGTNAHIIISDYISEKNGKCADDGYHTSATNLSNTSQENTAISYILPLSAKSKSSLVAYREYFIKYLTNTADCLANIAYTLQLKRESYIHRTAIVANSIDDAIEKFSNVKASTSVTVKNEAQNIIFMFPGQGAQYPDMTIDLYQHDKDYQVILDNCLLIINKHVNIDFKHILFPSLFANENKISEDSITQINKTQWAQLALFSVSYALAKWLEKLNINASAYLGHSIGELVAATLSGVFSLNDAIKLVVTRGTLMQNMVSGSMLHIQANADAITKLIQENHCEIAVINSPQQCVISGTLDNIFKIKSELDKMAIPAILLKVSHGYHSYLMEEAAKQFANEFAKIKLYPPKQPFVSNITGDFINANDAINPNYWSQHIRQKVQFAAGIQTIYNHFNNPFFIQVGPGKELLNFVKQSYPSNTNSAAIISKPSNTYNFAVKNQILSKLWTHGCNLDFSLYLDKQKNYNIARLPRYYFDSKPYIFQPNIEQFVNEKNDLLQQTTSIFWRNIADQVVEIGLPEQYYTIAAIFLQLLNMDKISVHDDFFALGGDSISAISLITQLKNIGINLTLSDIIHINSVAKIYKFANDINNNTTSKIIVPLLINNSNQNKKIFLIHPVGGTIIRYINMVRSLNNQYDYYGIQNINIFNSNPIKADTLEELSNVYLNEILQIQGNGEYILMGSSLGGNIAYEIASQLTKLGKTVKFIAMFDSWARYFNETTYTDDNLETISKLQAENDKTPKNSGIASVYNNIINARTKLLKLALKYEPLKTKLKIYLFKAEELSSEYIKVENSYDNGWQKYTDTVMSIYNIPGNHDSIHLPPGIEHMVKLLQGVLD